MIFSIIIASYNQQEFLPDAIESALAQPVSEVIVVDDGSTDNSLAIAESYAKQYPIKIISQVNKGLASARNTGIMNAKGDWILPLDADDILLDNCIERIIETIVETDADIIAPSFKSFGTSNENFILMEDPKLEDFRTGNRIAYCSAVKTQDLKALGGYSPRMQEGYEDLHLWVNLLCRGAKIKTIPEVLWLYRTKEKSMWTESLQHHEKLLGQINKDMPEAKLKW